MATDSLVIHEIYRSIQGETSFAGRPCTLVRLSGCNLRCRWCDTPQAFHGGTRLPRAEVVRQALELGTPIVLVTGGEPLLQPAALPLLQDLCDAGRTVMLETSGERDISAVDPRVHRIVPPRVIVEAVVDGHHAAVAEVKHVQPAGALPFGDVRAARAAKAGIREIECGSQQHEA